MLMCLAYLQHEGILPRLQVADSLQPEYVEYFKQYFKILLGKATLEHEAVYKANVAFTTEAVKSSDQRTIGELVTGWFHFYATVFDPKKHAISVCQAESFLDRNVLRKQMMLLNESDTYLREKFFD